ncbi:MAG TPA: fatty acid biosynthesis transcriptional regulator [Clostridia bacterium]|nr:MAG: Transcription factor FapR [Firmicutes bacterium ADurb.Bin146]HOD92436.1 fatty acid biosynthesis transcriptional regulator [Clostridia bacterium]HQM38793.1 fatty acid biosynthesis transcriptional regulator [Clostridia bacterium]
MTKATQKKLKKLEDLKRLLSENPYMNDNQLAVTLGVSVPCIRNYRNELGIKEVRERIKDTVRSLAPEDIVGTITELKLNESGKAEFVTTSDMVFKKTNIVRGQYLYSFAESVAISVINAEASLVGVANIKYKEPVYANEKLTAKAEVTQIRMDNFFVWVFVYRENKEIFRSKFILVSI